MGYPRYGMYRNWLRDEFVFTCIYCLRRETWGTLRRDWELDHFVPKSIRPELMLDYDNLVYACSTCNRGKAAKFAPNPCEVAYGSCVEVDEKGEIHPIAGSAHGVDLIESLGLDAEDYNEMWRTIFDLLGDLQAGSKSYCRFFGYPKNLPDLHKEPMPPKGNRRPKGILESYYERDKRGQLPKYY